MSRTFFVADTHFNHEAIIRICDRRDPRRLDADGNPLPFESSEAMDRYMIDMWNSIVSPHDRVYHLGDFAHKANPKYARHIFEKLNGQKHLCIGNHDKDCVKNLPWGSPPEHIKTVVVDGINVVMCHYAMRTWPTLWGKSVHLFGHSHGKMPGNDRSLDVGVDCWDFMPVDLETILARMRTLPPFWNPEPGSDDEHAPSFKP